MQIASTLVRLSCSCNVRHLLCHVGFDGQSWYQQLFEYGLSSDSAQAQSSWDSDEELIPRLVTQLVLPLAAHSLKHAWKPHSRRSTAAAKAVLEDLLVYVPPEEPKLQVGNHSAAALCFNLHIQLQPTL